ncbi:MAG: hypothetical protein A4E65_03056 [Syntrophorhabdus sp. PtaU1.Bin153]|nr:MAG: hypothetical protein A4E65_03056 [Syntrophorhabdus sp. PtaU1.Bin153]
MTGRIIELARRYGYRMITGLLRNEGWKVNHKRVERIWRKEGPKVPKKQPKRRRLWFADGSCIRFRPQHKDHVWSYDFVAARTHDGKPLKMLTIIEEYTRESLCDSDSEKDHLPRRDRETCGPLHHEGGTGAPTFGQRAGIYCKGGTEVAGRLGGKTTLFIEPGSLWETGYIESFNGKLRNELLNGEIFTTLLEARVLIENWRTEYKASQLPRLQAAGARDYSAWQ